MTIRVRRVDPSCVSILHLVTRDSFLTMLVLMRIALILRLRYDSGSCVTDVVTDRCSNERAGNDRDIIAGAPSDVLSNCTTDDATQQQARPGRLTFV